MPAQQGSVRQNAGCCRAAGRDGDLCARRLDLPDLWRAYRPWAYATRPFEQVHRPYSGPFARRRTRRRELSRCPPALQHARVLEDATARGPWTRTTRIAMPYLRDHHFDPASQQGLLLAGMQEGSRSTSCSRSSKRNRLSLGPMQSERAVACKVRQLSLATESGRGLPPLATVARLPASASSAFLVKGGFPVHVAPLVSDEQTDQIPQE